MKALDDFSGTGWGVACQQLGIEEFGIDSMREVRATRAANGMRTIGRDVWDHLKKTQDRQLRYSLYIASPPCQTFSLSGKGEGRKALDSIYELIESQEYIDVTRLHEFGLVHDPRTALVLVPLVRIYRDYPKYVALEQVPTVLPVWERMAEELRDWGYSVWTGVLSSEQYGVPQVRKRAILIARRDGVEAESPTPTHSRYYQTDPARLDTGVPRWLSMAEGIGWGMTDSPMTTITAGNAHGPDRWASGGSSTRMKIDAKIGGPNWISKPTAYSSSYATYSERLSITEASLLQSYPKSFIWPSVKNHAFKQIGNAVPPLMGKAILSQFL